MLAGAALGTLPDLDVFIDYGDAVRNFTYHRGFSHSLLVLAPFSVALWLLLRRFWAPVREAPRRWLAAIALTLLTHPLLDAHTAYGTQLLWPLDSPPVAWSTFQTGTNPGKHNKLPLNARESAAHLIAKWRTPCASRAP